MTLAERLRQVQRNREVFARDPVAAAGLAAEDDVSTDLLRRFKDTSWRLHRGLRVWDPRTHHRRELDFVLTSPKEATVIELKNWSGEVGCNSDGHVYQLKRSGERRDAGALFEDLEQRVRLLREFHRREGSAVEPSMRWYVVFWNPRAVLDARLQNHPNAITWAQLARDLPNQHRHWAVGRVWEAIARFLGWTPTVVSPSPSMISFRQSLDRIGTWDWAYRYGGAANAGDLLDNPSSWIRTHLPRSNVESIELSVDRSYLRALFNGPRATATVNYRDGRTAEIEVPLDQTIGFHPAGKSNDLIEQLPIRNLLRIEYGYIEKRGVDARIRTT